MTRRQTASIVFVVLCVVLVAAAVTLNIGWIIVNGRRVAPLVLGVITFYPDHRRPHRLHGVPGPRNGHHRTARQLPQLGHPRVEDADRVDPPLPRNAAIARGRRRAAQGVLPDHVAGRRSPAAHRRAGVARRRRAADAASSNSGIRSISDGWCRNASIPRARGITSRTMRSRSIGDDLQTPLVVNGDVDDLRTAIANLLDNAVKYSNGAPQIAVQRRGRRRTPRGCASRTRRRHSEGAARPHLQSLLPLPAAGSKVKGTGLGLYIVRSIAKRHGGRVFAESPARTRARRSRSNCPRVSLAAARV